MAYYLEYGLRQLYDLGILDVFLPFILIFTLVFAVLQRTKILGKDSDNKPLKNFNVAIALTLALATVIPHILWGSRDPRYPYLANGMIDVVQVINNALPSVSLILVAVLMFLIMVGIWGNNIKIAGSPIGGMVTLLSFILIVVIFGVAAGWFRNLPSWLYFLRDPQTQALVVAIIIFGLIIKFITGEDKPKKDNNNFFKTLGETLEKIDK